MCTFVTRLSQGRHSDSILISAGVARIFVTPLATLSTYPTSHWHCNKSPNKVGAQNLLGADDLHRKDIVDQALSMRTYTPILCCYTLQA